ncbi:hypothetical protein Sme01_60210 [Sphaerisporangium melleum]|uniref:Uncharacterized protein n=1 Tax=Sphaerisporangium melleum TaxID=321316 RepID=A0A917RBL9_9ACTN|nr:hypothetical protein GCM10007964_46400 [Sphaerisporangium melleum]GII73545.1 hypothetical protein Sme01_60210 [Sphaerisporangium melleum]
MVLLAGGAADSAAEHATTGSIATATAKASRARVARRASFIRGEMSGNPGITSAKGWVLIASRACHLRPDLDTTPMWGAIENRQTGKVP